MAALEVDGRPVEAEDGEILLHALRRVGIAIPALCYHPALKPAGACRLCVVELEPEPGRSAAKLSCLVKVTDGLRVSTQTKTVLEARTKAFIALLDLAPQAEGIVELARTHGIELPPRPDGCVRCRLCVRVCRDIVGQNALKMEKRGDRYYAAPVEGQCIGCGTCVNVCPTGVIKLVDDHEGRTISIRDEVIGRHVLKNCEACGKLFATEKFLKKVRERSTDHHPDVKERHGYCPTCAKLFSSRVKSSERLKMK
ncbi:MAG: 2Fe-2S iron-sulfur cluster-binding protein [Pseudomonadota bacterium]